MDKTILKRAQDTYGFSNQITVATEELCELACVLSKYPRYPNHEMAAADLRVRVIDETADVLVVLEHIKMIFQLTPEEIDERVTAKLARLERWLDTNDSMLQTTIDREVIS